jgi:hypothetical protein
VTYSYTVDGKTYAGHRISLTTSGHDEAAARRVADQLPDAVEVHYNPSDPGDAVLQPSVITVSILMLVGGAIGLLIAAGMLFANLSSK